MAKLRYAAALTFLGAVQQVHSADLAIVLDDSAGMCGYLQQGASKNTYKQALNALLQAKDASHLSVEAYFLSNLQQALPLGAVIDRIMASDQKNCVFKATTSPLHLALDLQTLKAKSAILVTDLLFDEGGQGSSNSRSSFVNAFDQVAKQSQQSYSKWFYNSAGIMGLKAPFEGSYYSVQQQRQLTLAQTERPFYIVWLSTDGRFAPFLNQMNQLWSTPNWGDKKRIVQGAYTLRLLPTTQLVRVKDGLFQAALKPALQRQPQLTQMYYTRNLGNKSTLMPTIQNGEYPLVKECFKTTEHPLKIQFSAQCAKDGSNENALFNAKNFPTNLVLDYQLKNEPSGFQRQFEVTSGTGFQNTAKVHYQRLNVAAKLKIELSNLKSAQSFISNSPRVQNKVLTLNIVEKFLSPTSSTDIQQVAKQHWSSNQEPCTEQNTACQQAQTTTYLFDQLTSSLVTRLNANQHSVNLLNQTYKQPTALEIQYH